MIRSKKDQTMSLEKAVRLLAVRLLQHLALCILEGDRDAYENFTALIKELGIWENEN